MEKEKVTLSSGEVWEIETCKVKHILKSNKIYKDDLEKEVYIVSICSGKGMDEVEELDTQDYALLVKAVFKLGK